MKNIPAKVFDILFILVLIVAACFRLVGVNWDQGQHLHPDERFMTMVESAMAPVKSLTDYFNTDTSTLNPHNVGYSYYVYGDLPILIVRYTADWMSSISHAAGDYVSKNGTGGIGQIFAELSKTTNWAGYDEVAILGRVLSALADIGSIFLLYLIAARIYGRKVALLAAAFASVAVMEIQQSHFFTVDNFANFFMFLATYFAVEVAFAPVAKRHPKLADSLPQPSVEPLAVPVDADASAVAETPADNQPAQEDFVILVLKSALFWNVVGFGLALGMSAASKINAAPLAILLPIALATRYLRDRAATEQDGDDNTESESVTSGADRPVQRSAALSIEYALVLLLVGAVFSLISFRVFQPYAFSGPSFLNVSLNQKWIDNLKEQQNQATGDVDFPPALQWARRSKLFSLQNIVEWGLGWPLGILAVAGFLYMGWRILRGESKHVLLWSWTGLYFIWQSIQWNPTMRYQLPIYPLLALMAAWFALLAFKPTPQPEDDGSIVGILNVYWSFVARVLSYAMPVIGILVLVATGLWAVAFAHIYTVDQSRVQATRWIFQNIPGPYNLKITQPDGTTYTQPMPYQSNIMTQAAPYDVQFTALGDGDLHSVVLGHAADPGGVGTQTVMITISAEPGGSTDKILATARLTADFAVKSDARGESYTLDFDHPVSVKKGNSYYLRFTTTGALLLAGSAPVNESSWDDGLPLRMDGYDAFGGIYQGDHNFEMYWDDNADKLARFNANLDSGDYIFITSNRQWATTTRIPERYPLTTTFYRNLIGCPADKDIIWCYNVATPGQFKGALGYDLVQVFESFPTLGPWRINDQFAEEAFTVYDHPKVLIFQKRADYDAAKVHALLGAVDLSKVIHLTPLKASSYVDRDLMLPAAQLKADRAGGTWSELFSYESIQNKYPFLGLLLWYVAVLLLGWFTYPFLRLLLPGLADRGYPLAKISGLLLLAYFSWIVASLGGTYSRTTIAIGVGLIVLAGLLAGWLKRAELLEEIRTRGKYFLSVEGVFLLFLAIDLLIRIGNPDLWHPWKGGERPMDFAYLNAVLKTTTFPAYDPWFAGGYINYYYWGFVLVATPIKLLGIVPSLAFNFVLPTLFALLAIGGFSVAWNLVAAAQKPKDDNTGPEPEPVAVEHPIPETVETGQEAVSPLEPPAPVAPAAPRPLLGAGGLRWLSALSAGAGLVLIGNLGTVQMIYQGLQRLVVSNDEMNAQGVSIFQHLTWAMEGLPKLLAGQSFPFYPGDWYWIPSRVISTPSGSEITEFPLFTFLYSDLHAHMIVMPLTVLAIAWVLSVLLARKISLWSWLPILAFGGLAIGVLRPTNTWDFPTYLVLATLVTGYAVFRYLDVGDTPRFGLEPLVLRVFAAIFAIGLLVGFSLLFFQPFQYWYAQGYNSLKPWTEARSPVDEYWTHWGLFLFVLTSWMLWESRQWLASTPLSALSRLKPYSKLIWGALAAAILIFVTLVVKIQFDAPAWVAQFAADNPWLMAMFGSDKINLGLNVGIAWIAAPLAFWALTLMLRPGLPDVKRLVLFMIATGLVITIFVEVVVLDGDIGRMNTIFKFYLQVWIMFAICSAAAIGWIFAEIHQWSSGWRIFWYVAGGIFLASALLFTFTASMDKIKDRMAGDVPFTLDSITYMNYATYNEKGQDMDLSHDFRAIRWMQDNVKGSPVIIEGTPAGIQYTWFSRFSIYTGLPVVVGWQWHQEQQRVVMPAGTVAARGQEGQDFYRTLDLAAAKAFLQKYAVQYIIVGELERSYFPEGLSKFDEQDGHLWQAVYRDGDTVIYQVLP